MHSFSRTASRIGTRIAPDFLARRFWIIRFSVGVGTRHLEAMFTKEAPSPGWILQCIGEPLGIGHANQRSDVLDVVRSRRPSLEHRNAHTDQALVNAKLNRIYAFITNGHQKPSSGMG